LLPAKREFPVALLGSFPVLWWKAGPYT